MGLLNNWYPGKIIEKATGKVQTQETDEDIFTERIFSDVTSITFYQTSEGADRGIFYVYLTYYLARGTYDIGVTEQIKIPGAVIRDIKGDGERIEIIFTHPVKVKVTDGYRNVPYQERIVKSLEVFY